MVARETFVRKTVCLSSSKRREQIMSLLGKYLCDNFTPPTYLSFFTTSASLLITIIASIGNSDVRILLLGSSIVGSLFAINHILEGLDMQKKPFEVVCFNSFPAPRFFQSNSASPAALDHSRHHIPSAVPNQAQPCQYCSSRLQKLSSICDSNYTNGTACTTAQRKTWS